MANEFAIFDVLRRHGVPFVIIGGHAVNFHGYLRSTEDSDLIWLRSKESETVLFAALTELHAKYISNEIDPATHLEKANSVTPTFIAVSHLMMLTTDHGFVDLFDYVPGDPKADISELFKTSIEAKGFRFASVQWLRQMKRAAGRTKDQLDLENLPPETPPPKSGS
jgi:hypothetical protein